MASTGKRSKSVIKNQLANNTTQTVKLTSTYIGYVKDNSDFKKMRRLRVWIPELSPDPINGLYTVNWCSPYAGATPIQDSDKTNTSQTSYGIWFAPPDIDNEVVVMFANGDPSRGIYVGGIYQQNMNHMVPGIPTSPMTEKIDVMGDSGPSQEYNKRNKENASKENGHQRPGYEPLITALVNQGLHSDDIRGTSTSGARRSNSANVMGILTPGGNQFVMDDDADNKFIRFRTANGTQIIINDTIGVIYMITRSGNTWSELSDKGIDTYTTGNHNIRCHGDYNVHADGDINLYSGKFTNLTSNAGMSLSSIQSFNLTSGNKLSVSSGGQLSLTTVADMNLQAGGNLGVDSGGILAFRACSEIGMTACDSIGMKAAKINNNTGSVSTPSEPTQATLIQPKSKTDNGVAAGGKGSSTTTTTTVSVLVTHEPYSGHIMSNPGPATISTDSGDITYKHEQENSTTVTNTNWIFPVTGTISKNNTTTNNNGIVVNCSEGSTVISPRSGKIIISDSISGTITIDHLDGYFSTISNIKSIKLKKNDSVVQGQSIAYSTAINNISYINYKITKNSNNIDPSQFYKSLQQGQYILAGS